jgi:hypothetical protein
MKTILNLEGVKTLTKKEQTIINGAAGIRSCHMKNGRCCQKEGSVGIICDAGRCTMWGCLWF